MPARVNNLRSEGSVAGLHDEADQDWLRRLRAGVENPAYGRLPRARDKHIVLVSGCGGDGPYGRTDKFGYYVVENKVTMLDFRATILHVLGLDHERLTCRHAGHDDRLTDVHGRVMKEIVA